MSSDFTAQIIWVYDAQKLSIQQCHSLHQQLQSQPRQARYLILVVPTIPMDLLRTAVGYRLYQRLHHHYQQQLKGWSCYWDIPETHCWLEASSRIFDSVMAKRLERPVHVMTVGEPSPSMWQQVIRWCVKFTRKVKALYREWQPSANEAERPFKKTMKRAHPSLSVLTKYTMMHRNPGGPHVEPTQ